MPVDAKYKPVIKAACIGAGAIGAPGAFSFGLDVSVMGGIWTAMTVEIAKESKHPIDNVFAGKLAIAVLAAASGYVGGSKLAMSLLHVIPGAGTLAAMGVNSFLNFWFTWRMGKAVATMFDRGGIALDDVSDVAMYIVGIMTPLPGVGEMNEVVGMMRDSTLNHPETFKIFEEFRRK